MAGDSSLNFEFHLSGGVNNQDPALSLGGVFSNHRIETRTTTISAVGAAGDTRLFLASVSATAELSVLSIRDGASGGFYTRLLGKDVGGGWVDLLDPLPFAVAIGDTILEWRASTVRMPWGVTTAQQSADGFTEYFAGYIVATAGTWTDFGVHLEEFNPGSVVHEIAVASDPLPPNLNVSPNPTTPPDLSNMMSGGRRGSFSRPLTQAEKVPRFTFSGYNGLGFWLKRTVLPNSLRQSDQIISLVCTDNGSLVARCILHWNTPGFTPDLTLRQSPSLYIRGGAQFRANVKSVESGLDVEGVPVAMRKTSGPGTFYPPAAPSETDAAGNAIAHYTAPTDVGQIGQVVTVEAEV